MKKTVVLILALAFVLTVSAVSVFAVARNKEDVKPLSNYETVAVVETCTPTECPTKSVVNETVTSQKNFVDSNNNSICDNKENNECVNYSNCDNVVEYKNNYGYQHRNGNCYSTDDYYEHDYSNGDCDNYGRYYEDADNNGVCDNYSSNYNQHQRHGGHSKGHHYNR